MSAHMASSVASHTALLHFWAVPALIGITTLIDIALSFWIGRRARTEGRSFWYGFLLSLFLTPIVGGIMVSRLSQNRGVRGTDTLRGCPFCTKRIEAQAKACPFCGRPLPPTGFP